MRFDSQINLLTYTSEDNGMGDSVQTPHKRPIFAAEQSVRQSEFYQAAATGLKPEITFVIWTHEYLDEISLEFNGKVYDIIRTFVKKDQTMMELICSKSILGSS